MGKITVLDLQLISNKADSNFCQWKRLTGAVLSISENLRVKGHEQFWAKMHI